MHFPKKQSTPLTNMLAELNKQLGGTYFTIGTNGKGYTLNPTNLEVSERKYNYVSIDGYITFSDMYNYLSGILIGLKLNSHE
jgi:hypothetical protein